MLHVEGENVKTPKKIAWQHPERFDCLHGESLRAAAAAAVRVPPLVESQSPPVGRMFGFIGVESHDNVGMNVCDSV